MARHMEEVDEDVASYAAFQPKWPSRTKLSWGEAKTGRTRARCVGSGGTRSSLPTTQEVKACDAFRETAGAADPDEFERPGLDGRAIFTSTLAVLGPKIWVVPTEQRKVFGVPRVASNGSDLAEDREKAVLGGTKREEGFLEEQESLLLVFQAFAWTARLLL
eukprot:3970377-Amphidinium_carterae.1